jgi:hypothetical protein
MGALRDEDLAPDGRHYAVDWDRMRVGDSIFVPCINTTAAMRTARFAFSRRGWSPRFAIRIENHIWGVRIWRAA